jgi:hypothetical protein
MAYDNAYGSEQQGIARQRAMAQMLLERGNQDIQQQTAGGFVTPINPLQNIAKLLNVGVGSWMNKKADDSQKTFDSTKQKALADILSGNKPQTIQDGSNTVMKAPDRTFDQFGSPTQGQDLTPQATGETTPVTHQETSADVLARVQPQALEYMSKYGNTPEAQYLLAQLNKQDDRTYAHGEKVNDWNHQDQTWTKQHDITRGETVADTKEHEQFQSEFQKSGFSHEDASQMATFKQQSKLQAQSQGFQANQQAKSQLFDAAQTKIKLDATNNPFSSTGGGVISQDGTHGDEYLKSINPNIALQVKALADGRMAFPTGMALKAPYWQNLLQAVGQYDPNFDAVNYNSRAKTRGDFTSGKSAQNIKALNTAIGHLGHLDSQTDQTSSLGGFPLATSVNSAINAVKRSSGDSGVTNFDQTATALASELTQVFRGSGGAEADVKRYLDQLNSNASKEQKKEAIKNISGLLHSRTSAIGDQYNQGMGTTKDPLTLLNPEAQAVINRINSSDGKNSNNGWSIQEVK